ncbi:class D sortase [Clostridiisalibacter paucivorans]|uniref:class D sortase n=1 Tax=Clostridiisalibacter paucivorans TaxID=408753 RepID=UPI000478D12F|nr:class D sortase [Clostridiisalibacter paucivorans]
MIETKKRYHIKDIISIILIISGVLIIAYPSLKNYYYDRKQQEIMEDYLESMAIIRNIDEKREDLSTELINIPQDKIEKEQEEKWKELKMKWPVEASLQIDKIDLFMPIIAGATREHLNVSVSSINNTGKPWKGNNYAIAGHRSRSFGRHFNRLNEIEIGDEIIVVDHEHNKYIYSVFSKDIVDETEISVLEYSGTSEITLITCDPIDVTHPPTRLVIKAAQIN